MFRTTFVRHRSKSDQDEVKTLPEQKRKFSKGLLKLVHFPQSLLFAVTRLQTKRACWKKFPTICACSDSSLHTKNSAVFAANCRLFHAKCDLQAARFQSSNILTAAGFALCVCMFADNGKFGQRGPYMGDDKTAGLLCFSGGFHLSLLFFAGVMHRWWIWSVELPRFIFCFTKCRVWNGDDLTD